MRDFLPDDVRRREYVVGVVRRVYERFGFEPIETPAVENIETLLGKYGEEGNQLIFKILKRGVHEGSGEADLGLRYDLTVPLARVVAEHRAKLPRLFKRCQIQPVWRADRPARGRFREFYQCDVDTLGSTSPVVEAEQCAAVSEVLAELGFGDFRIRVNDRRLLTSMLAGAGVPAALHDGALVALDKLDRLGPDGVGAELEQRGVPPGARERLLAVHAEHGGGDSASGVAGALAALAAAGSRVADVTPAGVEARESLRVVLELTRDTAAAPRVAYDPFLARGLSYYTGAIMEINVPDLAGSLGGGGRYDNLVGMFSGDTVPACGFSLGLERILVVMEERGMFPASLPSAPADVMTAVFRPEDLGHALRLAHVLRQSGLRVLVYPDADKMGKQIKYASSRGIPCVAILGEDEIGRGEVTVKDLASGRQETLAERGAGAAVKAMLGEGRG